MSMASRGVEHETVPMVWTMQNCAEVLAGKRQGSISFYECIRFLNKADEDSFRENEHAAESLLQLTIEGFHVLCNAAKASDILDLLKFYHKANENDKWLLAGCSQVLPFLYQFALEFLSSLEDLKVVWKKYSNGKSSLKLGNQLKMGERIEIGAQMFELCVDYCDVSSKECESQMHNLAQLASRVLFVKKTATQKADELYIFDCLSRSASFALANVAETFSDSIRKIYSTLKNYRKTLLNYMVRSSEASIQRSIIRVVSIFYKFKENGKFAFPELRSSVSAFLRNNGKKTKQSDALLSLFQAIDVTHDDSLTQVETFRSSSAISLGCTSCLVTSSCRVSLVDVKSRSEHSFEEASIDWDEHSFSIQHERLNRLRLPWGQLIAVEWTKTGDSVSILASHSFLREVRVFFTSTRNERDSMAQQVFQRLCQYKTPSIAMDNNFSRELKSSRKLSFSQMVGSSSSTESDELKIRKERVESPFNIEDTVFDGLMRNGALLLRSKENAKSSSSGKGPGEVHRQKEGTPSTKLQKAKPRQKDAAAPQNNVELDSGIEESAASIEREAVKVQKLKKRKGRKKVKGKAKQMRETKAGWRENWDTARNSRASSGESPCGFPNGFHGTPAQQVSPGTDEKEISAVQACSAGRCSEEGVDVGEIQRFDFGKDSDCIFGGSLKQISFRGRGNGNEECCESVSSSSCSSDMEEAHMQDTKGREDYRNVNEDGPKADIGMNDGGSGEQGGAIGFVARGETKNEEDEADSSVSVDDSGTEFFGKLLQIVERTVKVRKVERRKVIEDTRRKVETIRLGAEKADSEAIAKFAALVRSEFDGERKTVAQWIRKTKQGLGHELEKLKECEEKKQELDKEITELERESGKEIGECKREIGVVHERLLENLRSTYESNLKRRKAVQQSDHLFRGI